MYQYTLLHLILATTNFGEFQKFAKISCRQNLLQPKLIDTKINYMAPNVYLMYRTNILIINMYIQHLCNKLVLQIYFHFWIIFFEIELYTQCSTIVYLKNTCWKKFAKLRCAKISCRQY